MTLIIKEQLISKIKEWEHDLQKDSFHTHEEIKEVDTHVINTLESVIDIINELPVVHENRDEFLHNQVMSLLNPQKISENDLREREEVWNEIQAQKDLSESEKQLLMYLYFVDDFWNYEVRESHKGAYQGLLEKGYAFKLDKSHSFVYSRPLTLDEAEKLAMQFGWKKEK